MPPGGPSSGSRGSSLGLGRRFDRGLLGLAVGPLELLVELVHAAGRVDELHGARVVRVALRADLDRDLRLRAPRLERVAAAADHVALLVLGVNPVFHGSVRPASAEIPALFGKRPGQTPARPLDCSKARDLRRGGTATFSLTSRPPWAPRAWAAACPRAG